MPTFIVGGWYDLFQRGEPRNYRDLKEPPGRKQLLMGPWYHITAGDGLGKPGAPPALDVLALAWFNRWVRGQQNGIDHYGPVTVQQLGSNTWETYRQYPRGDANWQRWYLRSQKSGSANSLNDGSLSLSAPSSPESDAAPANQLNGLCTRSTIQWTAGLFPPGQPCESDNRTVEATGLTYTSPPLSDSLHLSGPLGLRVQGATTARDTTWIATISDVSPSGQSDPITAGWLVQSFRALDRSRTMFTPEGDAAAPFHPFTRESLLPVTSGQTDAMDVEIFNTDAVLAKGHRLRLTVTSGDLPHMLAPVPIAANSAGSVNTVHSDPGAPSYLTVGVAPLGAEPAASRNVGVGTCVLASRKSVSLRLTRRRGRRVVNVTAYVNGKRTLSRSGRNLRSVTLRSLPRGALTVKLVTVDNRGRRAVTVRRYGRC